MAGPGGAGIGGARRGRDRRGCVRMLTGLTLLDFKTKLIVSYVLNQAGPAGIPPVREQVRAFPC